VVPLSFEPNREVASQYSSHGPSGASAIGPHCVVLKTPHAVYTFAIEVKELRKELEGAGEWTTTSIILKRNARLLFSKPGASC
jgi:hypothetical protein